MTTTWPDGPSRRYAPAGPGQRDRARRARPRGGSVEPFFTSSRRSAGAPTWSGSSLTVRRSSVSSGRCWLSRTTSGPSRGVTCASSHSVSRRSMNHHSRIQGRRSSPHARRLPSISPRHRVHDEEVGAANVTTRELLHHSSGLNPEELHRRTKCLEATGFTGTLDACITTSHSRT